MFIETKTASKDCFERRQSKRVHILKNTEKHNSEKMLVMYREIKVLKFEEVTQILLPECFKKSVLQECLKESVLQGVHDKLGHRGVAVVI